MAEIDLTPQTYVMRSRVRASATCWFALVLVCAAAAVTPVGVVLTKSPDTAESFAAERLTQAQSRLANNNSAITSATQQLLQHQRELRAQEHLTRRPDWSAVIHVIASQFDQDLMMTGIQLGDAEDNRIRTTLGPIAQGVPKDSAWLVLSGVAETNSNVPGLILRLENTGLFQRVVMTGTKREIFSGQERTGFTLACQVN